MERCILLVNSVILVMDYNNRLYSVYWASNEEKTCVLQCLACDSVEALNLLSLLAGSPSVNS